MKVAVAGERDGAPHAEPAPSPPAAPRTSVARHGGIYLVARFASDALGLVALGVYTRVLSPGEYGTYAMVIATSALVHAVLYNWLSLGVARFLPEQRGTYERFLASALAAFAAITAVITIVGVAASLFWPDRSARPLFALGTGLLVVHAWFEMNLEVARAQLAPGRYALLSAAKGAISLAVGVYLAHQGWGARGLLAGLIVSMLVVGGWGSRKHWPRMRLADVDREVVGRVFRYGAPLTGVLLASFIVDSSDRLLLGTMAGADAAGVYSASYVLAKQGIIILMLPVALATFPVAVRAMSERGLAAAQAELQRGAVLLLALSVPGTVGLMILAPSVAHVFLGPEFRAQGGAILPIVAFAVFLLGMQQYHFGRAFTLSKNTWLGIWPTGVAAAVNLGLNLLWIPRWGVMGALYATVAGYGVSVLLTWWIGLRLFPLPFPTRESLRIALAAGVMAAALVPVMSGRGPWALGGQVALGAAVYGAAALAMNVAGARGRLSAWRTR
ncbi:lipopolysaccharide biosynthesis protein [Longimicrobium terrae]|uniref:O-antigen/teichoic acid export membrane protein n=1 Tax=Longimicrobium terrae TaxID=1639882 RepID=A0A841GJ46_9BACT|nr:polysaccharide biosynthesis C-terminal domain-containing protein [Longimicrobium terrae]MBB4634533.1 O-antigen/teichoic acid export membrane protein [Longimicrobium terrae]MBB6068577.1 O-antigen/teichoic acid export membrane protein [Longimicrobium terrae]NNC27764.1 oligosaccharide flippase family protein [Longimicrobium terrae]